MAYRQLAPLGQPLGLGHTGSGWLGGEPALPLQLCKCRYNPCLAAWRPRPGRRSHRRTRPGTTGRVSGDVRPPRDRPCWSRHSWWSSAVLGETDRQTFSRNSPLRVMRSRPRPRAAPESPPETRKEHRHPAGSPTPGPAARDGRRLRAGGPRRPGRRPCPPSGGPSTERTCGGGTPSRTESHPHVSPMAPVVRERRPGVPSRRRRVRAWRRSSGPGMGFAESYVVFASDPGVTVTSVKYRGQALPRRLRVAPRR